MAKKLHFRPLQFMPWIGLLFFLCSFLAVKTSFQSPSAVLQQHYKTIGDPVLVTLRTACIKGRYVSLTQAPITFVAYLQYPDKIKIEWRQGNTRWNDTYNSGEAWTRQNGVSTHLSNKEIFDLLWMLRSTSPIRNLDPGNIKVSQTSVYSQAFWQVTSRTDSSHVEFLLNKSGYEIALERIYNTRDEKNAAQEIKYVRYMDLGGVRVPAVFVMQTEEGTADLIYDEVLLGYPIPEKTFDSPFN